MPKTKRTKICRLCNVPKPIEDFHKHSSYSDGHRSQCKECLNPIECERMKARYNPEKHKEYGLRRMYGLEISDFNKMIEDQNGCCLICEEFYGFKLAVDHDHDTGNVRGLLCRKCNSGIGLLGDSIENLLSAAAYLRETKG